MVKGHTPMLMGTHILLYSEHLEADRAFFREALGFPFVDSGGGWLIFKLPVSEAGIHPIESGDSRPMLQRVEEKWRLVHGGRNAGMGNSHDDQATQRERTGSLPADARDRSQSK